MQNCILKTMPEAYHYPVMSKEVVSLLEPAKRKVVVDCTVGLGGHASSMLKLMGPDSFLIGIDRDGESLEIAKENLKKSGGRFALIKDNFINIDKILDRLGIAGVDAFLFDLGISTYQLNNHKRGFSFLKEGPLDMRMDQDTFVSAYDLVNNLSERELVSIFRKFGEERYAAKVARHLIQVRKDEPLVTTTQLARVVISALSARLHYGRIHPATRIFQALRIAVNRELESFKEGLTKAVKLLHKGGRVGVISFHSLEDRIAKNTFRDYAAQWTLSIITKKPLSPTDLEREENLASRSAKLRVAERI